jgi:Fungal N-terminal domain of STAND proteins
VRAFFIFAVEHLKKIHALTHLHTLIGVIVIWAVVSMHFHGPIKSALRNVSTWIHWRIKWALTSASDWSLQLPTNCLINAACPATLGHKHQPLVCLSHLTSCIELTYPMAEPISLASGLLALATFAFQSSITLYKTVQSFQSHTKRVRDLIEELEALSGVLGPLAETVIATTDVDLSALDLPLLRCGNSCKEFEKEIMKCSLRSGGSRTSFRDWAKLRYMGEDIDGFRRLLAGYKLTINIAMTDANL